MILAGAVNVGGVLSSIVKTAVVWLAFPHWSVAIKVTEAFPVDPQPLLSAEKLLDQVIVEQASFAAAPQ